MVSLKVNFKKKDLWLLSAIVVFMAGVGYVIAIGSGDYRVQGHDFSELQKCSANQVLKADINGNWACSAESGGGGGGAWVHKSVEVTPTPFPTSWTSLDLSSHVGSNRVLVLLRMELFASWDTYYFRTPGDPEAKDGTSVVSIPNVGGVNMFGYVLLETDSSGIIELKSNLGNNARDPRLFLVGYLGSGGSSGYAFGGMYGLDWNSNCVHINPYTGGCSCPAGYTATKTLRAAQYTGESSEVWWCSKL